MLFLISQYLPIMKTAIFVLLGIITGLLGLNYFRRGNMIQQQHDEIKKLKMVLDMHEQNQKINDMIKSRVESIDKENSNDLLRNVNNLPK